MQSFPLRSFLHLRCLFFAITWVALTTLADEPPYFRSSEYNKGKLGPYPSQSFVSSPVIAPRVNFLHQSPECHDGLYYMLAPRGSKVKQSGPMILDVNGSLVWLNTSFSTAYGLTVQKYRGKDYLTFWDGSDSVGGHGAGLNYMV